MSELDQPFLGPLGALPPVHHPTAYQYRPGLAAIEAMPQSYYLPQLAPDQQGATSACVGMSSARSTVAQRISVLNDATDLSPKMPWTLARQTEGTLGQNVGTFPHDALTAIRQLGICRRDLFPLDDNFSDLPSQAALDDAKARAGGDFWQAASLMDLLAGMADKQCGGIFCFAVTTSFDSTGPDGLVPAYSGSVRGYHAVEVEGYDLASRRVQLLNSWGTGWGNGGRCWMRFEDAQTAMSEAWIYRIPQPVQPTPTPTPTPEPTPVPPLDTRLHDTLTTLFAWFRDPSFGWDAAALQRLQAWQDWIDQYAELKP